MNSQERTTLALPLIGLGTYDLNGGRCIQTVATALELGYRHIDTAQMYRNERQVGDGVSKSGVDRADIFLTTKIWPSDFQPRDFIDAVERSLENLKVDYIDLLLLHWPQSDVPLAETLSALKEVITKGWVRNGGVSNFSVTLMEEAVRLAGTAVACNQVSGRVGALPSDVIRVARGMGIAVTAYSPLGRGALRNNRQLTEIGKRYGVTAAQVALRWLTQQGIAAVPKASSEQRLRENLAALEFTLDEADFRVIEAM